MTDERIISLCQNCGDTKKEHGARKPWKCPTRLADTNWKPWTVAEYREAVAGHVARLAGYPEPQERQLTKPEAIKLFQSLVARYGVQWTASVPREAYDQMAQVNKLLNEGDRREALGLRRK
jgi:alpha-L-arabinofuranosidase